MAAGSEWTNEELSAAVEAYLQMLALEQRGEKYNKASIQRMLLSGPIVGRTTTEQRMQNISHVLQLMERPWIAGYKPLPNVGVNTVETLRRIITDLTRPNAAPLPSLPPHTSISPNRKLPATGYWMFVCNRTTWDGEAWLRRFETSLLYKISEHNHVEVQPGDLGLLRLNKQKGTRVRPEKPAAVYAVVEVTGAPAFQDDPDNSQYADANDASKLTWRAPIQILANLVDTPLAVEDLPDDEHFHHFRTPLMASTIPISRRAFATVFERAGIVGFDVSDIRSASTEAGAKELEFEAVNADPKRRERISKYIERGRLGAKVKLSNGCRCQVCEILGQNPVAFQTSKGTPYAEAHHVMPVANLVAGSLAASNIMVLCPNHHRQAHYGDFQIVEYLKNQWHVQIDGQLHRICKVAAS